MLTSLVIFLLGVLLAPVIRPLARPLVLELVRAWLHVNEEVKRLSAQVKEDLEDAAAEAEDLQKAKERVQAEKAASESAVAPTSEKQTPESRGPST